jgi:hypothetical protein
VHVVTRRARKKPHQCNASAGENPARSRESVIETLRFVASREEAGLSLCNLHFLFCSLQWEPRKGSRIELQIAK